MAACRRGCNNFRRSVEGLRPWKEPKRQPYGAYVGNPTSTLRPLMQASRNAGHSFNRRRASYGKSTAEMNRPAGFVASVFLSTRLLLPHFVKQSQHGPSPRFVARSRCAGKFARSSPFSLRAPDRVRHDAARLRAAPDEMQSAVFVCSACGQKTARPCCFRAAIPGVRGRI